MILRTDTGLLLVSASLLAFSTPAAAASGMQEGEWESVVEFRMEIPGLPFAMPPMTIKTNQCLTEKDMVPSTARKTNDAKSRIKRSPAAK